MALATWRDAVWVGLMLACGAPAWAKVCHAEHEQVSLTGHLAHQTFAGPPNYESVRRGDAREVMPVLRLKTALCVRAPGPGDPRLKNREVKTLQLLDAEGRLPADLKRAYRVTGQVVFAESGHHHVPVLLEVERIEPLAGRH